MPAGQEIDVQEPTRGVNKTVRNARSVLRAEMESGSANVLQR